MTMTDLELEAGALAMELEPYQSDNTLIGRTVALLNMIVAEGRTRNKLIPIPVPSPVPVPQQGFWPNPFGGSRSKEREKMIKEAMEAQMRAEQVEKYEREKQRLSERQYYYDRTMLPPWQEGERQQHVTNMLPVPRKPDPVVFTVQAEVRVPTAYETDPKEMGNILKSGMGEMVDYVFDHKCVDVQKQPGDFNDPGIATYRLIMKVLKP